MRHYYNCLDKARRVAALASKQESAIYEVIGRGFLVGRTALRDEYQHAADTERGIRVVQWTDTDGRTF